MSFQETKSKQRSALPVAYTFLYGNKITATSIIKSLHIFFSYSILSLNCSYFNLGPNILRILGMLGPSLNEF